MKQTLLALLLVTATPAFGQGVVQAQVEAKLAEAPAGTRFGLVVADETGRELIAIDPDDRFVPASNTKIYTTAAAYASLAGLDQPDAAGGTAVRLQDGDVILIGRGDARLSSAANCASNCLAALADAVAAKTRRVRDVVGDDTIFPEERWSPGMSWNNIQSRYGTGISALTIDDNEFVLQVRPGPVGAPPLLDFLPYYTIENRAVTIAAGKTDLSFERAPNDHVVRLTGTIAVGAETETLRRGIDDPAHYAAWRLKTLLEARGVDVSGEVAVRHRPLSPADDPAVRKGTPAARPPEQPVLAALTPEPLAQDIREINKVSQNLHAELLLRRVGLRRGSGSIADGVAEVEAMLAQAGVPRTAWDLSDGSGMSSYNRTAPRGTVKMLQWIAAQPWGDAFRETLPVGGLDGTLARRFTGTALERRIFAKTGTLNASNALSGYMIARSGRMLTFSMIANDMPADASATKFMDAALLLVADAN